MSQGSNPLDRSGRAQTAGSKLKGFTGHQANAMLGRTGAFWQDESYDHLVRNVERSEEHTSEPAATRGTSVTRPLCGQCAHGRLRKRLDRQVPRGLELDAYDPAHGHCGARAL